jgi:DNA polymerase-3 subunit epsilon
MRQIIIDTETTGLDPTRAPGHRGRRARGRQSPRDRPHGPSSTRPEREIDIGATEVHGMTWDDLKGKPRFGDVAAEFIAFATGGMDHP